MGTLRYSQQSVNEDDIAAVVGVMRSDWLTCGPKIEEFEAALAEYVGAKYAVAVSSGTAALHLCFLACPAAWKVTTSPLTFVATANAVLLAGGNVGFVDVDPSTGLAEFAGKEPGVVVPVHYAGRAARIPYSAIVIEDACHALGAMDAEGVARVGSCRNSLAACFSFHPVKPITTLGEGGAVTTNDQGFADEVRSLRSHGRDEHGLMVRLGLNYRMTDAAAAMGIEQLGRCDEMRERRQYLATIYGLMLPEYGPRNLVDGSWHLYPVRIKDGRRDGVKAKLQAQGIGVQVHYNPIVPLHPYYRQRFSHREGSFPNAEAWAAEELSLPLHAGMTERDVGHVVGALREALNG